MTRRLHHLFGHLALAAMLLLASLPTVGRLVVPGCGAAPVAHQAAGAHVMAMPGATHATPAPARHPGHQHDDDCAYCALLGAAVPPLASSLALPAALLPDFAPRPWQAPRQSALPPGALGSRGPPTLA